MKRFEIDKLLRRPTLHRITIKNKFHSIIMYFWLISRVLVSVMRTRHIFYQNYTSSNPDIFKHRHHFRAKCIEADSKLTVISNNTPTKDRIWAWTLHLHCCTASGHIFNERSSHHIITRRAHFCWNVTLANYQFRKRQRSRCCENRCLDGTSPLRGSIYVCAFIFFCRFNSYQSGLVVGLISRSMVVRVAPICVSIKLMGKFLC